MDLLTDINHRSTFAPLKIRLVAASLDLLIFFFLGFILSIFFGTYSTKANGVSFNLNTIGGTIWLALWFCLVPINEGLTGQTIGKRICGIKVVKINKDIPKISSSIIRHLFDLIDFAFLFIGLILIAVGKKKQRLGDIIAKTYVVSI